MSSRLFTPIRQICRHVYCMRTKKRCINKRDTPPCFLSKKNLFSSGFSSFFSGSLSSGCFSCLCCLSGCNFSFLLSNQFSLSCILCFFFFKALCSSFFLVGSQFSYSSSCGSVFSLLPCLETAFCLFLGKRTLLYTTEQVLHKHHTLVRKKTTNCVGRLCTYHNPM